MRGADADPRQVPRIRDSHAIGMDFGKALQHKQLT
jgi:hypothetical protein